MTSRYYDLVSAEVTIDTTGLQEKLDELENFDASDIEDRLSVIEGLNTCGVDMNDLADIPDRVDSLERAVDGSDLAALQEQVRILEAARQGAQDAFAQTDERLATQVQINRALQERIETLELMASRIERLEAASNLSYNFFALAGKMITLLINARS